MFFYGEGFFLLDTVVHEENPTSEPDALRRAHAAAVVCRKTAPARSASTLCAPFSSLFTVFRIGGSTVHHLRLFFFGAEQGPSSIIPAYVT